MGWSCSAAASNTMQKIVAACRATCESQNVFKLGDRRYFWESSNVEHADGAITGSVFKMLPNNMAKRSGSFRIEPDGTMSRGPAFMMAAAAAAPVAVGMSREIVRTVVLSDADRALLIGR